MEYMIIMDHMVSPQEFAAKVVAAMSDGWRPQGGIYFDNNCYYQAMIR